MVALRSLLRLSGSSAYVVTKRVVINSIVQHFRRAAHEIINELKPAAIGIHQNNIGLVYIRGWCYFPPTAPVTPNLKDLINELKSVSDWYSLGVNLNFQRHQLNEIERNYRGDDKRCKTEMLGFWLDSTTPTWKAVADALRLMEAHMVADNIQRKYITSSTITEGIVLQYSYS